MWCVFDEMGFAYSGKRCKLHGLYRIGSVYTLINAVF